MDELQFRELRPSTITGLVYFDGIVNTDLAFLLFKVTPIEQGNKASKASRRKLPQAKIPGSIISLRYKGLSRGLQRSTNTNQFKHSITIDIGTSVRNVNVKLSASTVHMVGAVSKEHMKETATYILNYLTWCRESLQRLHTPKGRVTVNWLRLAVRSNVTDLPIRPQLIPEHVDEQVVRFCLEQMWEFTTRHSFCDHLDWLQTVESPCAGSMEITKVETSMINYSYGLGFPVSMSALAVIMSDREEFSSIYFEGFSHSVRVVLPYEPQVRKKNKFYHHTFQVATTGCVTQSSPTHELAEDAFELFKGQMLMLRPYVSLKLK